MNKSCVAKSTDSQKFKFKVYKRDITNQSDGTTRT